MAEEKINSKMTNEKLTLDEKLKLLEDRIDFAETKMQLEEFNNIDWPIQYYESKGFLGGLLFAKAIFINDNITLFDGFPEFKYEVK